MRTLDDTWIYRCALTLFLNMRGLASEVRGVHAPRQKSRWELKSLYPLYGGDNEFSILGEGIKTVSHLKVLRAKNLRVLRAGFRRKDARGVTIVPLKAWIRLNVACMRTVSGPVGSAGHIPFWYYPNKSIPLLQNLAFITNIRKKSSWITGSFHHLEAVLNCLFEG